MSESESKYPAVLDILSQVLEIEAADLQTRPNLATHGWDSMSSLEALSRLENHFHMKFDLRSFTEVQTPTDIVALLPGNHSAN